LLFLFRDVINITQQPYIDLWQQLIRTHWHAEYYHETKVKILQH